MTPRRRPISYFWALEPGPTSHLSDDARDGLDYAGELSDDARFRVDQLLHREARLPPVTINDVAEACGRTPAAVRRCIKRARKELYGTLSDQGIYYRRRRQKLLKERSARRCAELDCPNLLPRSASAAR